MDIERSRSTADYDAALVDTSVQAIFRPDSTPVTLVQPRFPGSTP